MRRLLSILTIVMLFAHAVLGCCPHHPQTLSDAHGLARLAGGCRGPETLDSHSVLRARQCCDNRPQRENSPECKCLFNLPAKVRSAKSPLVRTPFVALLSPLGTIRAIRDDSERCLRTRSGRSSPSRLHLVHQVLLI